MDILLFGPPGAGKGTQAGQIAAKFSIPHVSTGDQFRKHLKENTELGQLARSYMDRGALVPDEVVFQLVADRLSQPDAADGVLYDGFPRTIRQAELLKGWLSEHGRKMDAVLNMEVPDAMLVERLSGRRVCKACGHGYHVSFKPPAVDGVCDICGGEVIQRPDDAEEVIRNRLSVYHDETAPVLAWMRKNAHVIDLDATRSIDAVGQDVITALSALS